MELFTFEKVSFEQFKRDMESHLDGVRQQLKLSRILNNRLYPSYPPQSEEGESSSAETWKKFLRDTYDNIKLPCAATNGSAGFDFFMPFDLWMHPGTTITIPTGIRWVVNADYNELNFNFTNGDTRISFHAGIHLSIYPRSGLGFKYHLGIANTVGIIDEDYFKSDNEGHIMIRIHYPMVTDSCNGIPYLLEPLSENKDQRLIGEARLKYMESGDMRDPAYKNSKLELERGKGFAQGIVTMYLKNPDFTNQEKRNGGFGSTGK